MTAWCTKRLMVNVIPTSYKTTWTICHLGPNAGNLISMYQNATILEFATRKPPPPPPFNYYLNGHAITSVHSAKYLGVTVTANLSWNSHCDIICTRANGTLGLLRRILSGCSAEVKARAYNTFVRPKLEYASCAWNPYTKRNIAKIEMIQRRAARFVYNDYSRYTHVTHMINSLGWVTLENRRLYQQMQMFYKIQQGMVGITFPNDVVPSGRVFRLSNPFPYRHLQCNNNTYKFSFYPRAIRNWNNLCINPFPTSLPSFKSIVMPQINSM